MLKIAVYNRNDLNVFAQPFNARNQHTDSADIQKNFYARLACLIQSRNYFLVSKAVHLCNDEPWVFRSTSFNFTVNHCNKTRLHCNRSHGQTVHILQS